MPDIPDKISKSLNAISINEPKIQHICQYMAKNSINKIKHDAQLPFSIIKSSDDNFFAIYRDEEKSNLGQGAEGKVKYVKNLKTNEIFACKIASHASGINIKETFFLEKTGALHAKLTRESINSLKTYLIMELGSSSLDKQLPSMNKDLRLLASYRMLEEIIKLHTNYNIAHGDYVSSNVLFNISTGKLQIIDFGKSFDLTQDVNPEGKRKFDLLLTILSIKSFFKELMDDDIKQIIDTISREFLKNGSLEQIDVLDCFNSRDCISIKDTDSINFNRILKLFFDKISDPGVKKMIDQSLVADPSLSGLPLHSREQPGLTQSDILKPVHQIKTKYEHEVFTPSEGRFHADEVTGNDFKKIKEELKNFKGDHLKSKILQEFKTQIEQTHSQKECNILKKQIENSPEYEVLKSGQGLFTSITGIPTTSQEKLEQMFKEQENWIKSLEKSGYRQN